MEKKLSLLDRIIMGFKKLHYPDVEDERVLSDFKYLKENGQDSLFRYLVKNPTFEYSGEFYQSENWKYFIFLYDKVNLKKLPEEIVIQRFR